MFKKKRKSNKKKIDINNLIDFIVRIDMIVLAIGILAAIFLDISELLNLYFDCNILKISILILRPFVDKLLIFVILVLFCCFIISFYEGIKEIYKKKKK